jgi:predicted aspartyl protease
VRKSHKLSPFLTTAILCLWAAAFAAEPAGVTPATSAPAAPAVPRADEPLFASPTRLDRIGRIVAPVTINGQGPFRLVVDTGASHTTLSPEMVARLGLSPKEHVSLMLNGVTGAEQVPAVRIDRLQAGDLIIENVDVPIVQSSIMAGADGILGVAGLQRERITVDFSRDRISISRSHANENVSGMLRIQATRVVGGLLMVETRVGGVKARTVIDTGAERTLGNAVLRDRLRLRKRIGAPQEVTSVFGTTSEVSSGELHRIPTIVLGGATINQVNVVFGDFHIFKVWELDDEPTLLLGMDVLGTVRQLIIDYRRREVYVRA